jgi:hypothetical protein
MYDVNVRIFALAAFVAIMRLAARTPLLHESKAHR